MLVENGDMGIIGGADTPTAMFLLREYLVWIVGAAVLLVIAAVLTAFFKNRNKDKGGKRE